MCAWGDNDWTPTPNAVAEMWVVETVGRWSLTNGQGKIQQPSAGGQPKPPPSPVAAALIVVVVPCSANRMQQRARLCTMDGRAKSGVARSPLQLAHPSNGQCALNRDRTHPAKAMEIGICREQIAKWVKFERAHRLIFEGLPRAATAGQVFANLAVGRINERNSRYDTTGV
ncbi:hypothetical protein Ddc_06742 [Ditylenchus destructor]|nr:hypothetical protein Ddc_06742 [Ditylenchus destructor]